MTITVRRSTIIAAPIDRVWAILRDFNGHDRWHPAVADSALEDGLASDVIGAVRSFHLAGGEHLREQLLALSDHDYTLSYCLVQTPIPLDDYVAHLRLMPVTEDDTTYWDWWSTFRPPAGREQELADLVGDGVYRSGMAAIRALMADSGESGWGSAGFGESGGRATTPPVAGRGRADTREQAGGTAGPGPVAVGAISTMPLPLAGTGPAPVPTTAIVLQGYGGPDRLTVVQTRVDAPQADQVRVGHRAIGLNYIDVYCRTGQFDLVVPPGVPGLEASGVVLDTGASARRFQAGDRVAYAGLPPGAYCTVRNLPEHRLVKLPDDIDHDTAAAVMVKGLTAGFLLHEVHRLQAHEIVLVHAAAGGVGQLLVQWATALGATVIGTVGSDAKVAIARELGCAAVINTSTDDFLTRVLALTDHRGVDLVIDGIGTATFERSIGALAERGHLISYGQASGAIGSWNIDAMAARSLTLSRPNFNHYVDTAERLHSGSQRLFDALRRGIVTPRIGRRFPLTDAADAHRWLESRQGTGANLLLP